MRGRKPTSTALKIVTGNPGHRPLPEGEPEFKNEIPKCPLDLDPVGKNTWKEKSKLLFDAGVLTEADGETLAIYCRIWSQIVLLSAELKTPADYMAYDIKINEDTGEEIKVNAKTNPLCVRLENLYSEYRAYSALLALDPANRGKIKTGNKPQKEKTGKERFF
jgi:P27 family predicted phage terminase small subunit